MDFGEQVLRVRSELNLSQESLGKELGVTNVTVCRWENGKSRPTKRQLGSFWLYCKRKKISLSEDDSDE